MFYDTYSDLCQARKISCTKAATEMGLSNATPTKWKKTGATPDGSTLTRIADYFNVSVDDLLHSRKEENEETETTCTVVEFPAQKAEETESHIREDDMDLIRKHFDLMDKLHHVDEANEEELAERIAKARGHIRKTCRRRRAQSRRMTVFVQRLFDVALVLFGTAVVIALLVG